MQPIFQTASYLAYLECLLLEMNRLSLSLSLSISLYLYLSLSPFECQALLLLLSRCIEMDGLGNSATTN